MESIKNYEYIKCGKMRPTKKEILEGRSKHDKFSDRSKDRKGRSSKKDKHRDIETRERFY